MRTAHRRSHGYLLIEVLLSLLLVSTLLSALTGLQLGLHRHGKLAMERTLATAFAEQRMESLQGLVRSGSPVTGGSDAWPATGATDPEGTAPLFYWRSWSVAPISGVMAIEVRVGWPGPDSPHQLLLAGIGQPAAATDSGWDMTEQDLAISP